MEGRGCGGDGCTSPGKSWVLAGAGVLPFLGREGGREVMVDCGQFAFPACTAQFSSVPAAGGDACSQKEEHS